MSTTKQLQRVDWKDYFDRFMREHIGDDAPEIISPTLGDQFAISAVRLLPLQPPAPLNPASAPARNGAVPLVRSK